MLQRFSRAELPGLAPRRYYIRDVAALYDFWVAALRTNSLCVHNGRSGWVEEGMA